MISVCDLGTNPETGKIIVVDQRDFHVPPINEFDYALICEFSDCDKDCHSCIIERIQNLSPEEVD